MVIRQKTQILIYTNFETIVAQKKSGKKRVPQCLRVFPTLLRHGFYRLYIHPAMDYSRYIKSVDIRFPSLSTLKWMAQKLITLLCGVYGCQFAHFQYDVCECVCHTRSGLCV